MDNIPEMPEDFWPSGGVVVSAKHGGFELGFTITKSDYMNKRIEAMILPNLAFLKKLLYQAQFAPQEELVRYGLRESPPLQDTDGSISYPQRT